MSLRLLDVVPSILKEKYHIYKQDKGKGLTLYTLNQM